MKLKIEIELGLDLASHAENDSASVSISIENLPVGQRDKLKCLSDLIYETYQKQLEMMFNVKKVNGKLVEQIY
jgi:hypothetical protein